MPDAALKRQPATTTNSFPLVVDGDRECVKWVASLPADWTTDGERLVLMVMACDAYSDESAPGLDNIAAWTGMRKGSVARILDRLLEPNEIRPALLVKTRRSKGGPASSYRLLTTVSEQSPLETVRHLATVTQLSPTETVDPSPTVSQTVSQTVSVGDPPSPFPEREIISLSPPQQAVAKALGLQPDDERLGAVDEMLKANNANKPCAWIVACARNGDLSRLLDEAHTVTLAATARSREVESRKCPHGVINGIRAGQCPTCTPVTP